MSTSSVYWRAFALPSTLIGVMMNSGVAGVRVLNYPAKHIGEAGDYVRKSLKKKKGASKKLQE